MLAGTPDTVVVVDSEDEAEAEMREEVTKFFVNSIGRLPSDSETNDMVRYMLWHPDVVNVCNKKAAEELFRSSRAQSRVLELEARLRETQQQRLELYNTVRELKKDLDKLRDTYVARSRRAEKALESAKRQMRVLRGRLANRDARIRRLQRDIVESALVDPRVQELTDELARKNHLLKLWREFAVNLQPFLAARAGPPRAEGEQQRQQPALEFDRPVSADSGRESAEPSAGPSSRRRELSGMAPYAVRSILAAQQDTDSDDEITVMAEVAGPSRIREDRDHEIFCRCDCGKRFIVKAKGAKNGGAKDSSKKKD